MGLDMYLKERIWVGGDYDHMKATGTIEWGDDPNDRQKLDAKEINEVIKKIGYWRKANQIHNWFVTNIQEGKDECQESYVSYEDLMKLKEACETVLKDHSKAQELLPTGSGFFFGCTDYDEGYYQDLEDTIKILGKVQEGHSYTYQASW